MLGLSYLYLIPFFFSARTASIEFQLVPFYRLVLLDAGRLLDQKWKVQSIVNCTTASALAFPLFLLIRGGERALEPFYFAFCVILFVPVFTMLALALGTIFACTSVPPNAFGIRPYGAAIYFVLTIIMYSFLLNRMVLGAALYSLFLVPLTLLLHLYARRLFSRLNEKASAQGSIA
jgi:hypothetical protein